jgi:ferredoxin-NADP reductase
LIELTIQSQYKGKVTPWMQSNLKQGNAIGISDAMGEFVMEGPAQPVLFLAAGSGITPFRSMLQQAALTKSTSPMTLLYYTRGEEKQVFAKELQALAQDYPWITVELIDTTHRSRVNVHHIAKFCDDAQQRAVFICGPQGFIQTAQKAATDIGVPPEQVCIEQFQLAARPSDKRKGSVFLKRMNKQSKPTSGKTLLEIAEYEGATPNAGCRMGICHQCKCQKKEGTVMNVLTGEYSDSGEETIQLCVSVPIGQVELDL